MSNEREIKFGVLHQDGTVSHERSIKQADVMRCPHVIMVPEHYREDGTCRCDDPEHIEMSAWGYKWKDRRWQ